MVPPPPTPTTTINTTTNPPPPYPSPSPTTQNYLFEEYASRGSDPLPRSTFLCKLKRLRIDLKTTTREGGPPEEHLASVTTRGGGQPEDSPRAVVKNRNAKIGGGETKEHHQIPSQCPPFRPPPLSSKSKYHLKRKGNHIV